MKTKQDKVGKEVTQHSTVTHSVFCTNHLFYFFMFINHNFSCVLHYLFHVLRNAQQMRIDNLHCIRFCPQQLLIIFWSPKKEGYYVTGSDHVPEPLQGSSSFMLKCETPLNKFEDYLSVFFQKTTRYFWKKSSQSFFRTILSIGHFSATQRTF